MVNNKELKKNIAAYQNIQKLYQIIEDTGNLLQKIENSYPELNLQFKTLIKTTNVENIINMLTTVCVFDDLRQELKKKIRALEPFQTFINNFLFSHIDRLPFRNIIKEIQNEAKEKAKDPDEEIKVYQELCEDYKNELRKNHQAQCNWEKLVCQMQNRPTVPPIRDISQSWEMYLKATDTNQDLKNAKYIINESIQDIIGIYNRIKHFFNKPEHHDFIENEVKPALEKHPRILEFLLKQGIFEPTPSLTYQASNLRL